MKSTPNHEINDSTHEKYASTLEKKASTHESDVSTSENNALLAADTSCRLFLPLLKILSCLYQNQGKQTIHKIASN